MGLNCITETKTQGSKTIQITKDTPDGVVRYFDHTELNSASNLDIHVRLIFPDQKLDHHQMFINIGHIRTFLDREHLYEEHIDNLHYDEFECYICMGGLEDALYTHDHTHPIHFHKDCYHELANQIEELVEKHIITIQSEGKSKQIK